LATVGQLGPKLADQLAVDANNDLVDLADVSNVVTMPPAILTLF
jgi:hypothetical protein